MSGLLHEVVISLPVRAGFGLPTLYFALPHVGVAIERSRVGRRWKLHQGFRGWLFVILFTAGPLYWLFHPAFVRGVIVPFLTFLNQQ
jgi:alginate O-acetyltransferase complex protein AlgI